MRPPIKSTGRDSNRSSSKESQNDEVPSLTLWVGNLSTATVDSDLREIFGKYGALDTVTAYSPRTYAFVYFKNLSNAKSAKDDLQGFIIRGKSIQIEFARLAKPGKYLWIGGISLSATKEQLEGECLKFGKIEEFKFLRDRNSAFIAYYKIDDAIAAQKNMNGMRLAGEQIRVDFQRSQSSRTDWPDHHESRGNRKSMGPPEPWMPTDGMRNFHDSPHLVPKRDMSYGGRRDGQPTNTLWVGYPPSVHMDEQLLHNAMILFGEIERIKSFPSRNYSFVEFRSVDEARRAKEGLQGRLFNDPRIQILFSCSELRPSKDNAPLLPGFRGPSRPDMFLNEGPPFGQMELFGPGRLMVPNTFPGHLPPNGMSGPSMSMRQFHQQEFENEGVSDFHDLAGPTLNFPDGNVNNSNFPPNWRQLSPSIPGILPSAPGMRPPFRPMPAGWDDEFDMRDPKRSRIDGLSPNNDASFHGRRVRGEGIRDMFGLPYPDGAAPTPSHLSPIGRPGQLHGSSDNDHCWRGVIAKGGTPVCHARCVPIGNGIDLPLPEVVNCSARTGLDLLTKHYAEAIGFDIVFFLPDSEEDFASYTEFLQYLGLKDRAGVAKFDDGTTLFLVPPSDFLTKVLNVLGPERLYGVVLKMAEQPKITAVQRSQAALPPPPHYVDRQWERTSQKDHEGIRNEDPVSKLEYGRVLHDSSIPHAVVAKPSVAHPDEPRAIPSALQNYVKNLEANSQVEVSLTPELIATLASIVPTNIQSSTSGTNQMASGSSGRPASFPNSEMHNRSMPAPGWSIEHQTTFSRAHSDHPSDTPQQVQQYTDQFTNQAQFMSQFPTCTNMPNRPDNSVQPVLGDAQIEDLALNMPQYSATPTRSMNNYWNASQGREFSVPQSNQQYQPDSSYTSHNSTLGMLQVTDVASMFNQTVHQQSIPTNSSAHGQIGNLLQQQAGMPSANATLNTNLSSQVQQLQMALSGSEQGTSEGDPDKNQRYQSTLQFAANLLLKIQQQQQASGQAQQGSGN